MSCGCCNCNKNIKNYNKVISEMKLSNKKKLERKEIIKYKLENKKLDFKYFDNLPYDIQKLIYNNVIYKKNYDKVLEQYKNRLNEINNNTIKYKNLYLDNVYLLLDLSFYDYTEEYYNNLDYILENCILDTELDLKENIFIVKYKRKSNRDFIDYDFKDYEEYEDYLDFMNEEDLDDIFIKYLNFSIAVSIDTYIENGFVDLINYNF